MGYVQAFADGSRDQVMLLGGKGAGLAEMTKLGLPVPPGFTITTDACRAYLEGGERLPDGLLDEVAAALRELEQQIGRRLGDAAAPLLLSVRSGAPRSMPGMMDTVLNLGLNPQTLKGLAAETGNDRFAHDAYARFLTMYGRIVLGVTQELFDAAHREVVGPDADLHAPLDLDGLTAVCAAYEQLIETETGKPFPTDPPAQLEGAIAAVFDSWNGRRARDYRRLEGISDDLGTAVNVQAMVFGNTGDDSGTGVAFTRDPSSGEPHPYGDFLVNAQGEDVVSGTRRTQPLAELATSFPECHHQLDDVMRGLEEHYRDMCDIEFTIEHGRLFILQTRVGKRSSQAAVRIAVDLANEGVLDHEEAVLRVTPEQLERLLHPRFDPDAALEVLTTGLNAAPGAASGAAVFTADDAVAWSERGEDVILVRPETSPEDLHGMIAARGILTSHGGLVSHAAVVARGIGKPAVCGANDIEVDPAARQMRVGSTVVAEGERISIDGSSGQVVLGDVAVIESEPTPEVEVLLGWADGMRRLGVWANADTAEDAARARAFGAEGIGLCRTEHMFLGDRLPVVRRMILAATEDEERAALDELHTVQLEDFTTLLREMSGLPVVVRLLDPPLHEFLPDTTSLLIAQAQRDLEPHERALLAAARSWEEVNPMLGVRGVRLGILKPDVYRMQVRSLIEAAVRVRDEGLDPVIEIMIPLVVSAAEVAHVANDLRAAADETLATLDTTLDYQIGIMVETPRAALTAAECAQHVDFFSFGTNDLTQMAFGFSRDDVEGKLMHRYLEHGLLDKSPFESIDVDGVGALVRLAVEGAKSQPRTLTLGICGEHGGDPTSIAFFDDVGLDYVSCSPFRVPVARLAAAHAAAAHATASAG